MLQQLPGIPFVISLGATLNASHTIPVTASGALPFQVPAGYTIQSCQGYAGNVVPTRPWSWGSLKQRYR